MRCGEQSLDVLRHRLGQCLLRLRLGQFHLGGQQFRRFLRRKLLLKLCNLLLQLRNARIAFAVELEETPTVLVPQGAEDFLDDFLRIHPVLCQYAIGQGRLDAIDAGEQVVDLLRRTGRGHPDIDRQGQFAHQQFIGDRVHAKSLEQFALGRG